MKEETIKSYGFNKQLETFLLAANKSGKEEIISLIGDLNEFAFSELAAKDENGITFERNNGETKRVFEVYFVKDLHEGVNEIIVARYNKDFDEKSEGKAYNLEEIIVNLFSGEGRFLKDGKTCRTFEYEEEQGKISGYSREKGVDEGK